jgi:3-oxosteroid 1-dehydrogenase
MTSWDREVDVLVAGSGAGGLSAALAAHDAGLDALVVEKAAHYGGSTALSGGALWIPDNPVLRRLGRTDDPDDVLAYLHAVVGDRVPAARLAAYAEHGPAAVAMLERVGRHAEFSWCPGYSDYHPEADGGRAEGRTIEPVPFDARQLGSDAEHLLPPATAAPLGLWLTGTEFARLLMMRRTPDGRRMLRTLAGRALTGLVRRRRMTALGQALVGRLRAMLAEAGTELWLRAPVVELVAADGAVVGAVVERDGRRLRIGARAVVLATGGFDHDPALRAEHLPAGGRADASAGAASNTGDGHRLGAGLGAALDLMDDAWWMPSIRKPDGSVFPLVAERAIPSSLIVDQRGERFANEAAPYVTFVHAQLAGGHAPVHQVLDARARRRYQYAATVPGQRFPRAWYRSGLVTSARTLPELAARIGVPPERLVATVDRFGKLARAGFDDDFGRGESAYDRYYGDPTLPNPVLAPLTGGPYYAVRLEVGDLGTKGGLVCDEHARVLREDGSPVAGLYATGNVSASVMGTDYAGAGATIGPAVVFGYLAARHIGHQRRGRLGRAITVH